VLELGDDATQRRQERGECHNQSPDREDVSPPNERTDGDDKHHRDEAEEEVADNAGEKERDGSGEDLAGRVRREAMLTQEDGGKEVGRGEEHERDAVLAKDREEDAAVESSNVDGSGSAPVRHGRGGYASGVSLVVSLIPGGFATWRRLAS